MSKRVVFAGGMQAKALAKAYRLDVALDSDEDVFFIGAESMAREAAQKVVSAADILVTDVTLHGPTVPEAMISVGTLRIAVPVVTADFLWPYAAKAHPKNMYSTGLPDGPYPAGFGDSYLDMLAEEGVSEDDAVARYLALDVAEDAGLDRMLTDTLSQLRRMDAETGFDLAEFVAANFRTQYLFATRDRVTLPLFRHLARLLFGRMGVPLNRIAQISDTFLPVGAMPLHPSVLRHFGISEPPADYAYPFLDEGYFSFEAYCRRYWRYEFNKLLHAAIAKAENNPSEAIPELQLALESSPESRAGMRALRDAERAVSDATMLPPLGLLAPQAGGSAGTAESAMAATEDGGYRPAEPLVHADSNIAPDAGLDEAPERMLDDQHAAQLTPFTPKMAFGSSLFRPGRGEAEEDDASDLPPRFTEFPREPGARTRHLDDDLAVQPTLEEVVPEPQGYEELRHGAHGETGTLPAPTAGNQPASMRRYVPLPPAEHLIPMLPKMLLTQRGMAGQADRPFLDMPETMPPPPLRPVLPPELHPEPVKLSLLAKIMDQLRK